MVPTGDTGRLPFGCVHVISLPGSSDRRRHSSRHLPEADLPGFAFQDAIGPELFRIERDHDRLHVLVADHAMALLPPPDQFDLAPVDANKPYKDRKQATPPVTAQDWAALPADLWNQVAEYCHAHDYARPERAPRRPARTRAPDVSLDGLGKLFCGPAGWSRSMGEQRPLRANGRPLPWFTYGAIEFLERVACRSDRVFEYRVGHSTLWWQDRVRSVTSVEHDAEWVAQLGPQLARNVRLSHLDGSALPPEGHDQILMEYRQRMCQTAWRCYDSDKVVREGLRTRV